MTFFVDTNFFLQCKNYREITWNDITSDQLIEIYIARPIQKEIDNLKSDGNSRRAKRARKASSLFRKILQSSDMQFTDQVGRHEIVFKFGKNYLAEQLLSTGHKFDLSRPDDELIASLAVFLQEEKVDDVFFYKSLLCSKVWSLS